MWIYISPDGVPVAVFDRGTGTPLERQGYRLWDEGNNVPQQKRVVELGKLRGLVNLNSATIKELEELGITIAIARAIVRGRPYQSISDIATIDGLDFDRISSRLTVE